MSGPTRSDDFYDVDRSTFWGGLTGSLIDAEQGIFDWQDENLRKKDGFQNTTDQYLEQEKQAELESGSYREQQNPLLWSGSAGYPKFGEGAPSLLVDQPDPADPDYPQEIAEQGGILSDPNAAPDVTIKSMTENRARNIGNPAGVTDLPKMPTQKEQSQRIQQEQSKQVLFDQTKLNNWYESPSFYNGMLSMGLSLMAGADIATAFNAGAQTFERNFGIEKRKTWANDLRAAGYDDLEIERYIETGDNKVLTDPMEKQRQARRDALAEAQLRKAEYESDPARLAYKDEVDRYNLETQRDDRLFNRQMRLDELAVSRANRDLDRELKQLQIRKARQDLENKAAVGTGGKVQPRDAMLAVQQMSADLNKANRPLSMVGAGIGTVLKGVAGQEYGSDLAYSSWAPASVKEAQETRNAQNQFIDNGLRLATGAVAKENEMAQYRAYLFPQGDEFKNPTIVARKKATQDFFNQTARNIALGKTKEMDPAVVGRTMRAINEGTAKIIKHPQTGEILGYQDTTTGYVHTFD